MKFCFVHTNTFCKYKKKLRALPRVHLVFVCDRLLNYSRSVLNINRVLLQFYQYTVAHCQVFFK